MEPKPTPDTGTSTQIIRLADLAQRKSHRFSLRPEPDARRALAADLDILGIKKLSFNVELSPAGSRDWDLKGDLGATVVQSCVATLDPVTTRLDEKVERRYRSDLVEDDAGDDDDGIEMPEDDSLEPLPVTLDLGEVMAEALSLALPLYPRAKGVETADIAVTEPGKKPMTDEDAKPFAGLADFKRKLEGPDET